MQLSAAPISAKRRRPKAPPPAIINRPAIHQQLAVRSAAAAVAAAVPTVAAADNGSAKRFAPSTMTSSHPRQRVNAFSVHLLLLGPFGPDLSGAQLQMPLQTSLCRSSLRRKKHSWSRSSCEIPEARSPCSTQLLI